MTMKKKLYKIIFGLGFITLMGCSSKPMTKVPKIVTNPMNLNYRFQPNEPSRREAADPVAEYFKGYYYLFASKSGGYWRSEDLAEWDYISCQTIDILEDYAPTILALGDTLYYTASGGNTKIYKNAHPENDSWELMDTQFEYPQHDPAFYKDDDGRVYFYWGCSNVDPIMGVEVDPKKGFKAIGEPKILIEHHGDLYGWEVPGVNNEEERQGWNEGPCVIKFEGRYYLHYAAPGTQYRVYADGVYVSDYPLGPFDYVEDNPFSIKPGGFIGGAGHGHTFQDKYGNYWHVASMVISVRHSFERRLGLFPVGISSRNGLYSPTVWSDYPFYIPEEKVDFNQIDLNMGWNLLSYNKPITASSFIVGYEPQKANDERVETWWAAQTGDSNEWLQIDLKETMTVNALQVNFADHNFTLYAPHSPFAYQYHIEGSTDGENWIDLVNEKENKKDEPHRLFVLDEAVKVRYVRITNATEVEGSFSLFDLRVFGIGNGSTPAKVTNFKVDRDSEDSRIYRFSWDAQENVIGYVLHWGTQKDKLTHAVSVYDNTYEARYFNRDSEYYFSIEAFNENGKGN